MVVGSKALPAHAHRRPYFRRFATRSSTGCCAPQRVGVAPTRTPKALRRGSMLPVVERRGATPRLLRPRW